MRTSGLVLDIYDDYSGETLRAVYPTQDSIPGTVKEAHVVTAEDRQRFPDDVFALVLVNGEEKLRKYACIDEGNTILSVQYFLKHGHKLPEEAQKTAAANLMTACGWYDVDIPEQIEKVALGLGTMMSAAMAAPIIQGTGQTIKENVGATRALHAAGNGIVTPQMRDEALGRKTAEANGTTLMPLQGPGDPGTAPKSKTVIPKTAAIGRLAHAGGHDTPPDLVHPVSGEQAPKHPQAGHLRPTVDVTNKEPPRRLTEKKAEHFALPDRQRYPLDSYAQVKAAASYFAEYYKHMEPETRHVYATNLVKRASAFDIPVVDVARRYGSETLAEDGAIKAAFDARRIELAEGSEMHIVLDSLEDHVLSRKLATDLAVETLSEFDKTAGLNHHYDRSVPDPYFSLLGAEKTAETIDAAWSDIIGNDMVTTEDLRRLAKVGAFSVKTTFGHDFQNEFLKDPVGMYKSLPLDQKKMLIRMANSTQPGVERTYY